MFEMCFVGHVGYWECEMLWTWDVCDVKCWECTMFGK